ncbi:MAG TPA: MFS transporter [Puia sp.]|nr:MFS transporter [Puia sp.]
MAINPSLLVSARIVGGIGVGFAAMVAPMFISELSPARHRGTLVSLYQLAIGKEEAGGDPAAATEKYAEHIAYIHFRNVRGKVPHYKEVFVDEGDIDMIKILRILKARNFQGVLIPDHTPQMTCDAPWYAGMAYALGFMKAAIKMI